MNEYMLVARDNNKTCHKMQGACEYRLLDQRDSLRLASSNFHFANSKVDCAPYVGEFIPGYL